MLSLLGKNTVLLSTVNNIIINEIIPTNHTTPPVTELHKLLNDAYEKGAEYLSMEVSSHALSQFRVEGLKFDSAIFTIWIIIKTSKTTETQKKSYLTDILQLTPPQ